MKNLGKDEVPKELPMQRHRLSLGTSIHGWQSSTSKSHSFMRLLKSFLSRVNVKSSESLYLTAAGLFTPRIEPNLSPAQPVPS